MHHNRGEENLVRGDRYRPVRRGAFVCFLMILAIALLPEIAGVGAPGIGGGQWALLLFSGCLILVSTLLGRIDGRYLIVSIMTLGTLSFGIMLFTASKADVGWMLWRMKAKMIGNAPLAIHQEDTVLGWCNRPMSHAVDAHYDYRVEYHIGAAAERSNRPQPSASQFSDRQAQSTNGEDAKNAAPQILCLGGSFTFGQGVEDFETFSARLEALLGGQDRVVNGGVNGWGTVQVMLQLERILDSSNALTDTALPQKVFYGFLPIHANRNSDRESWLAMLSQSGRRKPVVVMGESGRWEFSKLVGVEEGRLPGAELNDDETQITLGCIAQMDEMCRERGVSFVCLLLGEDRTETTPEGITCESVRSFCQDEGIAWVDCTDLPVLRFPHDGHPTVQWHESVAQRLSKYPELSNLGKPQQFQER